MGASALSKEVEMSKWIDVIKWTEIIEDSFVGSLWEEEFEEISYGKGVLYILTGEEKKKVRSDVSWEEVEALVKRLAEVCGKTFDGADPLLRLRVGNIGLVATRGDALGQTCALMKVGCVLPDWIRDVRLGHTVVEVKETDARLGEKGQTFLVVNKVWDMQTNNVKYILSKRGYAGEDMRISSFAVTKEELIRLFLPNV